MKQISLGFRCITYQEEDGSFTGVCLDLDIVEENHATLEEAVLSINEAVDSHLQAAAKHGFPKELLSRPAPKEYWNKLKEVTQTKKQQDLVDPFRFFTTQPHCASYSYT